MKSTWFRRFLALSAIAMLCFAASPTQATVATTGWVWVSPSGPYGYSSNEANWIYFQEGLTMWFYNYGTDQWSDEGPDGWMWFSWRFVYSVNAAAWIYIAPPTGGFWIYHYSAGVWEWMG